MTLLYFLIVRLYFLIILISSPFYPKALLWLTGRRAWRSSLKQSIDNKKPIAWFHCASLGEFEQGRPLIEEYKRRNPNHAILLTFFSPSGYEVRKGYKGVDYVFYLPLDTKKNAKDFIDIVKPIKVFFIKYEFWFHYLNELSKREIPIYLVSAIFRPNQIFFRWYGGLNRRMVKCFNHIFLQDKDSIPLLESIGITNVTVAGDTRFDRVYSTANASERIPMLEEFCDNSLVLVAGSTWPEDEEIIIELIKETGKQLKFIIAPHEIDSSRIEKFRTRLSEPSIRFTNPDIESFASARVLILDTIGILASAYRYGSIAYVGGGFGSGIHNTLEPATFGLPILFGPNYHKFKEAKELLRLGSAFSISSSEDLISRITFLANNNELRNNLGKISKEFVYQNIGATTKICKKICEKG